MTMQLEGLDSNLKAIYHRNQFRRFLKAKCELIKQTNKTVCRGCEKVFIQAYMYRGKYYCKEVCSKYEEIPM
tara:strand:+ start:137 stop:352 length:216 start_codon:yes stop_codon:yes gene_type:complete